MEDHPFPCPPPTLGWASAPPIPWRVIFLSPCRFWAQKVEWRQSADVCMYLSRFRHSSSLLFCFLVIVTRLYFLTCTVHMDLLSNTLPQDHSYPYVAVLGLQFRVEVAPSC